jgi:hypothetical protein
MRGWIHQVQQITNNLYEFGSKYLQSDVFSAVLNLADSLVQETSNFYTVSKLIIIP